MSLEDAFTHLGRLCRERRLAITITIDRRGQLKCKADEGIDNELRCRVKDHGILSAQQVVEAFGQKIVQVFDPATSSYKTFLERATPEQKAEVQSLIHRARCVMREVTLPTWVEGYAPELREASTSAARAADAATHYGYSWERTRALDRVEDSREEDSLE